MCSRCAGAAATAGKPPPTLPCLVHAVEGVDYADVHPAGEWDALSLAAQERRVWRRLLHIVALEERLEPVLSGELGEGIGEPVLPGNASSAAAAPCGCPSTTPPYHSMSVVPHVPFMLSRALRSRACEALACSPELLRWGPSSKARHAVPALSPVLPSLAPPPCAADRVEALTCSTEIVRWSPCSEARDAVPAAPTADAAALEQLAALSGGDPATLGQRTREHLCQGELMGPGWPAAAKAARGRVTHCFVMIDINMQQ